MKKSQRSTNFNPDDTDQSEWFWNQDLPDEEFSHHTYKAGRSASKRRNNATGTQQRIERDADE